MLKASKDIVVLETAISDEVIYQLQTNDFREDLNAVINEYARQLEEGGGLKSFKLEMILWLLRTVSTSLHMRKT